MGIFSEELKILDVNMFLVETAYIREQLKDLDDKIRIAQGELSQTQEAFAQTRSEYERLEQELEQLDEQIQRAREEAGKNALQKQQLENDIQILKEQIRAAHQSDQHYQERIAFIEQELSRRKEEKKVCLEEKEKLEQNIREVECRKVEKQEELTEIQERIWFKYAGTAIMPLALFCSLCGWYISLYGMHPWAITELLSVSSAISSLPLWVLGVEFLLVVGGCILWTGFIGKQLKSIIVPS